MNEVIWLSLIIFFVILEGITVNLVSIWFAIGSLAGFIATYIGADLYLSGIIAVVVSGAMVLFTRPFVKKVLKVGVIKTNVDMNIGKTGVVIEKVGSRDFGQVKLSGQIWTAKCCEDEEIYEVGTEVVVIAIEGVKLVVKKK